MIPDNPTEEQAKIAMMGVCPALLRMSDIYAALHNNDPKGVVCWESVRDNKTPAEHLESLWAALCLGWQFAETDMRDEWLLTGRVALTWLRQLPRFIPEEPVSDGKTVYIGKVSGVCVYTPVSKSTLIRSYYLYTGVARNFSQCMLLAFGQNPDDVPPVPARRAPMLVEECAECDDYEEPAIEQFPYDVFKRVNRDGH